VVFTQGFAFFHGEYSALKVSQAPTTTPHWRIFASQTTAFHPGSLSAFPTVRYWHLFHSFLPLLLPISDTLAFVFFFEEE
jgi:hypothetical protein